MTDKERINELKKFTGLNFSRLASEIGIKTVQTLYDIKNGKHGISKELAEKIHARYLNINIAWLLTGEGEMLKPTTGNTVSVGTAQQSTVVGGNYYGAPTHTQEEAQLIEAEQVPVVPVTIAKQPELDTIRYLRDNISQVEISSVRVDDTKLTLWLPMPDESMLPEISKGDRLGLLAYCRGKENPIPGKIYAVDTYSNGFVVRYLFITPNGDYLMRSKNPELFPDFIIKKDDVIAVYKKMIMVRI